MASHEHAGTQQPAQSQYSNAAVSRCPLFRVPSEVRLLIYGYALISDSIIKFHLPKKGTRMDHFMFKHCNETLGNTNLCQTKVGFGRLCEGCQLLGTGLLLTCRIIYDEALRHLFRTNQLDIHNIETVHCGLVSLSDSFRPFLKDIQHLGLDGVVIRSRELTDQDLYRMRQMAMDLRGLTSLSIRGELQICGDGYDKATDYVEAHMERFLNWFRPLSILRLTNVEVQLTFYFVVELGGSGPRSSDRAPVVPMVKRLERRIEELLLSDPAALEKPQAAIPAPEQTEIQDKAAALENARWDFKDGLVVGNIQDTMLSPLPFLSARPQAKGTRRCSL